MRKYAFKCLHVYIAVSCWFNVMIHQLTMHKLAYD